VLASLKMCHHFLKAVKKCDGKHRNVMEFAEVAVKKALTGLEMCWHSHKKQFSEYHVYPN